MKRRAGIATLGPGGKTAIQVVQQALARQKPSRKSAPRSDLAQLLAEHSEALRKTDPALVQELEESGLRRRKSADTLRNTLLRDGLAAVRTEIVRIVLRDLLNYSDVEHTQIELTALADTALKIAAADESAIIGLGKLGGQELTYGDDLEILCINHKPESLRESGFRVRAEVKSFSAFQTFYEKRAAIEDLQSLTRARFKIGRAHV